MSLIRNPDFDNQHFRRALGRFTTGVTIVTTTDPQSGEPLGLTVSSFNSVSMQPPLVLWSLRLESRNLEAFKNTSHFNIHILAFDQIKLARIFSVASPYDRFKDLRYHNNETNTPLLDPQYCSAWFECRNEHYYPAGDHIILIGTVERCQHTEKLPLVFHAGNFDLTPKTQE